MKSSKAKTILLVMLCVSLVLVLTGCGEPAAAPREALKLSFKAAASYTYLKTLSGQKVTINGYMATSSPADGSFIFLMNLPYQSCPFCKPNTSQLSNTMEVYPKKGQTFGYTTQAIRVTGTLQVADENNSFTDPYGYEFNFKIVDAEYSILSADELSEDVALWQTIAQSGLVNDLYRMYDYVNFLCSWPTYYCNSYQDESGTVYPGYYLYASDALNFLTTDGAQYNYGYQDGYFDALASTAEKLGGSRMDDLIANIQTAKQLAADALSELTNNHFTCTRQYVEMFDNEDWVYTLDKGDELNARFEEVYLEFANWLGNWEM